MKKKIYTTKEIQKQTNKQEKIQQHQNRTTKDFFSLKKYTQFHLLFIIIIIQFIFAY